MQRREEIESDMNTLSLHANRCSYLDGPLLIYRHNRIESQTNTMETSCNTHTKTFIVQVHMCAPVCIRLVSPAVGCQWPGAQRTEVEDMTVHMFACVCIRDGENRKIQKK